MPEPKNTKGYTTDFTSQNGSVAIPQWTIILAFPVLITSMGIVAASFAGETAAKLDKEHALLTLPRQQRTEDKLNELTLQVQRNADAVSRIEKSIDKATINVGYNQRLLIRMATEQGVALPPRPEER